MIRNTVIRNTLILFLIGALFFSLSQALERPEYDVLSFFFGERQLTALNKLQDTYTPSEALELKLRGKLPSLPVEPRPAESVTGEAVLEEVTEETLLESPLSEKGLLPSDELLIPDVSDQPLETPAA